MLCLFLFVNFGSVQRYFVLFVSKIQFRFLKIQFVAHIFWLNLDCRQMSTQPAPCHLIEVVFSSPNFHVQVILIVIQFLQKYHRDHLLSWLIYWWFGWILHHFGPWHPGGKGKVLRSFRWCGFSFWVHRWEWLSIVGRGMKHYEHRMSRNFGDG